MKFLNCLLNKKDCNKNKENIIKAIEESRKELVLAQNYFNIVKEPKLIDYAIYREQAAKAKYIYLLNEARKVGIKIKYNNLITQVDVI